MNASLTSATNSSIANEAEINDDDGNGGKSPKNVPTAKTLHEQAIQHYWDAEYIWAEADGEACCPQPWIEGPSLIADGMIRVHRCLKNLRFPVLIWRNDGEED